MLTSTGEIFETKALVIETTDELHKIKPLWNELKDCLDPQNVFIDFNHYCFTLGMVDSHPQKIQPQATHSTRRDLL